MLLLLAFTALPGCEEPATSDDEVLFVVVTNGAVQRDHRCPQVRDAELSSQNGPPPLGPLPPTVLDALWKRIEIAPAEAVQDCLAEVLTYNECFRELTCEAFSERVVPAWLVGNNFAPCGCGVNSGIANPGPFAVPGLPGALASCTDILPVAMIHSAPGFTCPE